MENNDVVLEYEERKKLISLLRGLPFENIVYSNYFKDKAQKKHGISDEKLKEIYPQFDKIIDVTKRLANDGDKYCFVYKINKHAYYLIFRLDRKPKELFDAYFYPGSIEKRIIRKYFGYFSKRR